MLKVFKKLNFNDDKVNRLQENVASVFSGLRDVELLDGIRLSGIVVATSPGTSINHSLERLPRGWLLLSKNGLGDVYETSRGTSTLVLVSSVAVTIDLWVF